MGRIKTMLVKRVTNDLMREHSDKFTTEFEKNKAIVEAHADVPSKKIRNIIAGYATRLKKKQEAQAV
ncbi:MAG: 30S ribosomal protein S17e [Candidatus Woesearchaeota archaeon]